MFNIYCKTVNRDRYFIVEYWLASKTNLHDAAWAVAIGQSVGNPNVRNEWETDQLFEDHSCRIIADQRALENSSEGVVTIAFPLANINFAQDGISHLLCQVMGGQLDIDLVTKCHVLKIDFPPAFEEANFLGPRYGIEGIRKFTKADTRPLLGGIVKPKIGVTPEILLEMVKEMVEGGINFIKEDEIMADPLCCPMHLRVPLVMDYLKDKNVVYAVCINADPHRVVDKVKEVHALGGNAVHINFWAGLGVYDTIRKLDLPLFIHFQKSGDKILTNENHEYHIKWDVICDLAGLMGVDFIHAGMWGGYMSDNESKLRETLRTLHSRGVLPALSCGMHPGLVGAITKRFGSDYMANCGGAIHGHPMGSLGGTRAMRQAIDGEPGPEYEQAIAKWGRTD